MRHQPSLLSVYRALTLAASIAAYPAAGKGPPGGAASRFGRYPKVYVPDTAGPRLWLHASSVGEAEAARPLFDALALRFPRAAFVVSTGTSHGFERAEALFEGAATVVPAPLDFPRSVKNALDSFHPHALILLETELWPNWIMEAAKRGCAVALVNGRISARSVGRYVALKSLFAPVFERMSVFSMIAAEDAARIRKMGAPKNLIRISGNAKYDALDEKARRGPDEGVKRLLGDLGGPVFVAGSTRTGEEEAACFAFSRMLAEFPAARLILAPRHVERASAVESVLHSFGLSFDRLSDLSASGRPFSAPALLVDRMGPLFSLYWASDFAFLGGSLVPKGGHNVLEPAAWAKPVLFGPHTEDFSEAASLLEKTGGGIRVKSAGELASAALDLCRNPRHAELMGQKARKALFAHQGAADRHAQAVADVLNKPV
ncbi:MAG: 3-deoxy-D-manno-octulosonic acid transferase [Deltaproteobacteria bacterium]|nr:3-deoxy-D-manno-octulosonic acid transferase [Deltaproteobacteria bacterium]